jgi:hypothetical protein
MHFFYLIYFNNHPLHVSYTRTLTIQNQEVALLYMQHTVFIMHILSTPIVLAANQRRAGKTTDALA